MPLEGLGVGAGGRRFNVGGRLVALRFDSRTSVDTGGAVFHVDVFTNWKTNTFV